MASARTTYVLFVAILVVVLLSSSLYLRLKSKAPPVGGASGEFGAISHFLASLPPGRIAFNTPTYMEVDHRSYDIYLRLSLSKSVEALQKELQDAITGQTIEGHEIRIAPRMEARLTGETFKILQVTPETQAVDIQQETEWHWEISPTRGGTRELHLTLSAIVLVNGQPTAHAMRTFDRKIEVRVTVKRRITDFVHDHVEWICGIIAGIAIAIWRIWKKKKAKQPKQWDKP